MMKSRKESLTDRNLRRRRQQQRRVRQEASSDEAEVEIVDRVPPRSNVARMSTAMAAGGRPKKWGRNDDHHHSSKSNNYNNSKDTDNDETSLDEPYYMAFTQDANPGRHSSRERHDNDSGPTSTSSSSSSSSDGHGYESCDSRIDQRKEPLRPGDVILYQQPIFTAGTNQGMRKAVVLETDPNHDNFPAVLSTGDCLPPDTVVRRVAEFYEGKVHPHRHGVMKPLELYKMKKKTLPNDKDNVGSGGDMNFANGILRQAGKFRDVCATMEENAMNILSGRDGNKNNGVSASKKEGLTETRKDQGLKPKAKSRPEDYFSSDSSSSSSDDELLRNTLQKVRSPEFLKSSTYPRTEDNTVVSGDRMNAAKSLVALHSSVIVDSSATVDAHGKSHTKERVNRENSIGKSPSTGSAEKKSRAIDSTPSVHIRRRTNRNEVSSPQAASAALNLDRDSNTEDDDKELGISSRARLETAKSKGAVKGHSMGSKNSSLSKEVFSSDDSDNQGSAEDDDSIQQTKKMSSATAKRRSGVNSTKAASLSSSLLLQEKSPAPNSSIEISNFSLTKHSDDKRKRRGSTVLAGGSRVDSGFGSNTASCFSLSKLNRNGRNSGNKRGIDSASTPSPQSRNKTVRQRLVNRSSAAQSHQRSEYKPLQIETTTKRKPGMAAAYERLEERKPKRDQKEADLHSLSRTKEMPEEKLESRNGRGGRREKEDRDDYTSPVVLDRHLNESPPNRLTRGASRSMKNDPTRNGRPPLNKARPRTRDDTSEEEFNWTGSRDEDSMDNIAHSPEKSRRLMEGGERSDDDSDVVLVEQPQQRRSSTDQLKGRDRDKAHAPVLGAFEDGANGDDEDESEDELSFQSNRRSRQPIARKRSRAAACKEANSAKDCLVNRDFADTLSDEDPPESKERSKAEDKSTIGLSRRQNSKERMSRRNNTERERLIDVDLAADSSNDESFKGGTTSNTSQITRGRKKKKNMRQRHHVPGLSTPRPGSTSRQRQQRTVTDKLRNNAQSKTMNGAAAEGSASDIHRSRYTLNSSSDEDNGRFTPRPPAKASAFRQKSSKSMASSSGGGKSVLDFDSNDENANASSIRKRRLISINLSGSNKRNGGRNKLTA